VKKTKIKIVVVLSSHFRNSGQLSDLNDEWGG
jgi:hypothetical protein